MNVPIIVPLVPILLRRRRYRHNLHIRMLLFWRRSLRQRLHDGILRRGLYCLSILNSRVQKLMSLDPLSIKRNCRITKDSFLNLMQLLMRYSADKRQGYSFQFAVIVTLYWMAGGMSYRVCGNTFDICRSTAFDLISMVLDTIVQLSRAVIKLPDDDEIEVIAENFGRLSQSPVFSLCAGVIDCCQVRFICDDAERHDEYINQKLYYSICMQALVDYKAKFLDVCIGFPGSCHDLRVLRHSGLYREAAYPPRGFFIIGDGGYPCMRNPITLIAPFKSRPGVPLTADQRNFNYYLSRIRATVERAFGLMQARWRVLNHRSIELKFTKAVKLITACAVMHNICVDAGDIIQYAPPARRPQVAPRDEREGDAYREMLFIAHHAGRMQAEQERMDVN